MYDLKNQQMKQNICNSTSLKRYRIDNDDESYPWWLRSVCFHHDLSAAVHLGIRTAAAVYFNVNYYNVYYARGVPLACTI